MRDTRQGFRARALAQAEELVEAIGAAETVIAETIERECEALRSGRTLAAKALHTRLCDAARLYLHASRAAQASIWTMEQVMPGCRRMLEERRAAFSSVLKVELAILATERAVLSERDSEALAEASPVRTPTPPAAALHPDDVAMADRQRQTALRIASSRPHVAAVPPPPPRRSAR
jgi:hypothetical protein